MHSRSRLIAMPTARWCAYRLASRSHDEWQDTLHGSQSSTHIQPYVQLRTSLFAARGRAPIEGGSQCTSLNLFHSTHPTLFHTLVPEGPIRGRAPTEHGFECSPHRSSHTFLPHKFLEGRPDDEHLQSVAMSAPLSTYFMPLIPHFSPTPVPGGPARGRAPRVPRMVRVGVRVDERHATSPGDVQHWQLRPMDHAAEWRALWHADCGPVHAAGNQGVRPGVFWGG